MEPYDPTRKFTAWFKKLGIHMVSRMVLNARVIYQILHQSPKSISVVHFIKTLAHEILCECSIGYNVLVQMQKESKPPKKKRRTSQPPQPLPHSNVAPQPLPQANVAHALLLIPATDKKK